MHARSSSFFFSSFSLVLASALAFGCSSSSTANNASPVIDDLQGPPTATVGTSGRYELTLTVSAHDDDGTIVSAAIEITGFEKNVIQVPAQSSIKGAQVLLQLDGRAPKGALQYTLVVTDDQGGTASKAASVTLQ